MLDQPQPADSPSTKSRTPAWIRLTAIYLLLTVVPIAVYLFLYQRSRIEQATIRNFRALDAAAERVVQVLQTLPNVVDSSAFGLSPSMLDEVTERITGHRSRCRTNGDDVPWNADIQLPPDLFRSVELTPAQRLEYRYLRAAQILVQHNKNTGNTKKLWDALHCLVDTHRRFSSPVESIAVDVSPLPRASLHPSSEDCGTLMPDSRACTDRLSSLLSSQQCPELPRSPRLSAAGGAMVATTIDCRPLEDRYEDLQRVDHSPVTKA